MTKRVAFRHRKTGEVHVTSHPDHYTDKVWESVPVPKPASMTAEERRQRKVKGMGSLSRYDDLLAQIAALRARLDKAGF